MAVGDKSFEYELPGGSIATFTWDRVSADVPQPVSLEGATATASANSAEAGLAIDADGSTVWTSKEAQARVNGCRWISVARRRSVSSRWTAANIATARAAMPWGHWQTIASGTSTGQLTTIDVRPVHARYLRITSTGSARQLVEPGRPPALPRPSIQPATAAALSLSEAMTCNPTGRPSAWIGRLTAGCLVRLASRVFRSNWARTASPASSLSAAVMSGAVVRTVGVRTASTLASRSAISEVIAAALVRAASCSAGDLRRFAETEPNVGLVVLGGSPGVVGHRLWSLDVRRGAETVGPVRKLHVNEDGTGRGDALQRG